ncbi:MAG: hypothetical protein AOA66_0389 [Candidatus Bathyarchaeota archaeon BA2]|nr:MAG: hypothetical protein AOA66_0389 [Candidatus Bathyarchaeota archaeon BA2]
MTPSLADFVDLIGKNVWLQIHSQAELLPAMISFIIHLTVMTIVFYVAGVIVVGKRRALFSDAFVISLLGIIVGDICILFFRPQLIGLILSLFVWLLLIRHYYETGWLGALAVAILAVIVYLVVLFILALLLTIPFLLFQL